VSQPLIIGAVTLAVADTAITDLRSNTAANVPAFRIIIGGFIVTVMLLALSDSHEEIADTVAILIVLTTLVGPKGGAVFQLLTKLTAADFKPPVTPTVILPTYKDPNAKYNLDPTKRG
jgi:hypothetical protein